MDKVFIIMIGHYDDERIFEVWDNNDKAEARIEQIRDDRSAYDDPRVIEYDVESELPSFATLYTTTATIDANSGIIDGFKDLSDDRYVNPTELVPGRIIQARLAGNGKYYIMAKGTNKDLVNSMAVTKAREICDALQARNRIDEELTKALV